MVFKKRMIVVISKMTIRKKRIQQKYVNQFYYLNCFTDGMISVLVLGISARTSRQKKNRTSFGSYKKSFAQWCTRVARSYHVYIYTRVLIFACVRGPRQSMCVCVCKFVSMCMHVRMGVWAYTREIYCRIMFYALDQLDVQ